MGRGKDGGRESRGIQSQSFNVKGGERGCKFNVDCNAGFDFKEEVICNMQDIINSTLYGKVFVMVTTSCKIYYLYCRSFKETLNIKYMLIE